MSSASAELPPPSSATIAGPPADTQAIDNNMSDSIQQGASTAVISLHSLPASTGSEAARELPTWKKLAREVRMMIFRELGTRYFDFNTHTTMPPIMRAFKPGEAEYAMVLKIFAEVNDNNTFLIAMNDTVGLNIMSEEEALIVKRIQITVPEWEWSDRPNLTGNSKISSEFCKQFQFATNIRRVEFAPCMDMENAGDAIRLITEFPFWLEGFPALEYLSVEISSPGDIFDEEAEEKLFDDFNKKIAGKVKVTGKPSRTSEEKDFGYIVGFGAPYDEDQIFRHEYFEGEWKSRPVLGEVREWVWKAPKNETMNWAQNIGELWTHTAALKIERNKSMQREIKAQDRELKAEQGISDTSSDESEEEENNFDNESEKASEDQDESEVENESEHETDEETNEENENQSEGENDGDGEGEGGSN